MLVIGVSSHSNPSLKCCLHGIPAFQVTMVTIPSTNLDELSSSLAE